MAAVAVVAVFGHTPLMRSISWQSSDERKMRSIFLSKLAILRSRSLKRSWRSPIRLAGQGGQLVLLSLARDLRDLPARPGDALGEGNAAIEQEAAHLTDHSGAVVDHAPPGPVQGLDVLLLDQLLRHEAHVRLPGGGADSFGIVAVGLLAPHERL